MNKFGYPSGSILWTATINNPGKVLACYEKNAKGNYDIVYPDIEFEILNPRKNKFEKALLLKPNNTKALDSINLEAKLIGDINESK